MLRLHPYMRASSNRRTQTTGDILHHLALEAELADDEAVVDWNAQYSPDESELPDTTQTKQPHHSLGG